MLEARGRARPRGGRPRHRTRPSRSTTPTSRAPSPRRSAAARPSARCVVCGSGAGVAVAACKVPGIRAACAHDTYTAHQCVEHDDVNVLCLGARVIGPALAADVIRAFLGALHGRGAPRAAAGEDPGDRARVRGGLMAKAVDLELGLPADRRARPGRRPAHRRAGRHDRHDRLVLLPGVRLAERVRLDPRRREGRLLRAAPGG